MAHELAKPVPLEDVLIAERLEIEEIRRRRAPLTFPFDKGGSRESSPQPIPPAPDCEPEWQKRDEDWVDAVKKAHESNFVGLAFSGGGIRSATFNLGVLQALADLKLLYRIDYLSTVSGGGYIGAWLAAWIKRQRSFAQVENALATNRVHQEDDKEPTPIRFLRMFSNYLTPSLGIFSGDTWATVGIYLRNMVLNQVVLLALLSAVLLLPRLAEKLAFAGRSAPRLGFMSMCVAAILLLIAFFTIIDNMDYLESRGAGGTRQLTKQASVLILAGLPLFATAVLGALWEVARLKQGERGSFPLDAAAFAGAIAYGAIWLVAALLGLVYRAALAPRVARMAAKWADWRGERSEPHEADAATNATVHEAARTGFFEKFNDFCGMWFGAIASGALVGWLYALLSNWMLTWHIWRALTYGVPLVVGILLLAGILHIGLMGNIFPDRGREWWGRLGGWLLLWGLAWLAIFWIALYFPYFIQNDPLVKKVAAQYLTPTWILTTLGGILVGKSSASGKSGTPWWMDWVGKVAPYVFIVGLLCWISWVIDRIQYNQLLKDQGWIAGNRLYLAIGGCLAVALVMAWRVDVNQFSMHLFYRNRLVRCYLGASNKHRSPNRFTGFDRTDDIHLKDFGVAKDRFYDGPYPVINSALNLVKGKDLAWQERKAESFVMTPRYCGYDVWLEEQDSPITRGARTLTLKQLKIRERLEARSWLRRWLRKLERFGYRRTEDYAFPHPYFGPDLGLAMGISGAAANPNMGSYSSIPLAFLMTIFNVRLGQWLGNPRHRRASGKPTPAVGLWYLVNELLAGTDDESAYVYLSDGGHFENLAMYELVKRRCGLIIVCDAEADGTYCFGGLGNAIRKCRIDLGIDIDLDVSAIRPEKQGDPSKTHFAVGKIHYENVDMNAPTGRIIYFKSSLTGDEPADVNNYQKIHGPFPHETTVDQWFTESQFESYRLLGYHAVLSSIPNSIRSAVAESDADGSGHAASPADPHAAGDSSSGAASHFPRNSVSAIVESAVATLAGAAASALRAGADAIAAEPPDSARDEAPAEKKTPTAFHWKKELGDFGFDVSNLRNDSK
jgi:Patatin-like phospholipase